MCLVLACMPFSCFASPCRTKQCQVMASVALSHTCNGDRDLKKSSKSIPRGPRGHQVQILTWGQPKCFKIDPWRPNWPSAPNLTLKASKRLQDLSLEAQAAISSKSGPGDLQNASKSIPQVFFLEKSTPQASHPRLSFEKSTPQASHPWLFLELFAPKL